MEDQDILDLHNKINLLESKVMELENYIHQQNAKIRTLQTSYSDLPRTTLFSHNFLFRALPVWGHYFVAQLIIIVVSWLIVFCGYSFMLGGFFRALN